jgi:hypothetical protein
MRRVKELLLVTSITISLVLAALHFFKETLPCSLLQPLPSGTY